MKRLLLALLSVSVIALASGCSTSATVGNHDQHGAGMSAKTEGSKKGVHAAVY
ncbi:MAG: hypothetical protein ABIT76_14740 [Chthoniobacterales bacterium]